MSNAVLAAKLDALGERFAHLLDEMRAIRSDSVTRELHDAHRAATEAEIARVREQCRVDTEKLRGELETERRERAALRRMMLGVIAGGVFTFVSSLTVALLT